MKKRGLLVVPFVALGIVLAFLLYTIWEKWGPAPGEESLLSVLPSSFFSQGGGVFYTNYAQLKNLTFSPSTPTKPEEAFLEFGQKSAPYDLSTTLFNVFYFPDFASELGISWKSLEEVAWTPYDPIEVVRGSFDWSVLLKRLEEEGFTRKEEGGAVYLDGEYNQESNLSLFGQVAQLQDFLIMEHFSTLKDYPIHRQEVIQGIEGATQSLTETDTWKAYSSYLSQAPSFYLGPAPELADLEGIVRLNPAVNDQNYATYASQRGECLLDGNFEDFCAYSVLNSPGKIEFLLRYKDEKSAQQDLPKLKLALERSYSSVFPGTNFSSLLGNPQVSQEGKFLRVSAHSQVGIKVVQAMVQSRDFGFLYKLARE
jgi:hypothetical protein